VAVGPVSPVTLRRSLARAHEMDANGKRGRLVSRRANRLADKNLTRIYEVMLEDNC
jgi:hypothetical protein